MNELAKLIKEADGKTVFFGGAGVSTESGIPDFRSADGIYSEKYGRLSPEVLVSRSYFEAEPEAFFDFYRKKLLYPDALPNDAHLSLAKLEEAGLLSCVVTQNIDGLHTAAGSKNVIELHGSSLRNHCVRCGKKYSVDAMLNSNGVPRCECGGIIRPDVTLYEEALPEGAFESAVRAVAESRLLIVGGTSLAVYPAASLTRYAGGKIVLINLTPTGADKGADLAIHEKIGRVLSETVRELGI